MRVGLISDTHNFLDAKLEDLFKGVAHIFHAGDVGMPWILFQLNQIAPVTAVLGNTDAGLELRESQVCQLEGRLFLVQHIVNPIAPAETLKKQIMRIRPDVVVFGHTHRVFEEHIGGTLFINPGYAGKPRFAQPRTVAVLHIHARSMHTEILPL